MPVWALLIAAGLTIAGGGYGLLSLYKARDILEGVEMFLWFVFAIVAGGALASAGVIIGIIQWVTA